MNVGPRDGLRGWSARLAPASVLAWSGAAGAACALLDSRTVMLVACAAIAAGLLAARPVAALALVVFLVGLGIGIWRLETLAADPFATLVGHPVSGIATVTGSWTGRGATHRADATFTDGAGHSGRILLRLYTQGDPPERGTRLAVEGVLARPRRASHGYDETGLAARRGIRTALTASQTTPVGHRGGPEGVADELRRRALLAFAGAGSGDSANLLAGLAIGADDRLSVTAANEMTDSGLSHLTAVSGENVALLVTLVIAAAWLLGAGKPTALVIAIGTIVAYVAVVGPSASVQRAAAVGVVVAMAWLFSRRAEPWHALGVAAAVLLAWNPFALLDVGFQLSFVAVVAILVAAHPLHRLLEGTPVPALVAPAIAVTVACTLATAPIIWLHFGRLQLVGAVPANVLAEPAVAPITWLGVSAAVLEPVDSGLAQELAAMAGPLCAYVLLVARLCAGIERRANPYEPALLAGLLAATVAAVAWLLLASRARAERPAQR